MAYDLAELGLGYAISREDMAAIAARSVAFDGPQMQRACAAAAIEIPKIITQRTWRKKPKMQGMMGACSGFAGASGGEILHYYATGEILKFSDMFCYLENQKQDGSLGSDTGASIDGSLRRSETVGYAPDETFPYTEAFLAGQYDQRIPAACEPAAIVNVTKRSSIMRSAEDCYNWLATNQGIVLTGTPWYVGMTQVSRVTDLGNETGRLLGWHARVLTGYDGNTLGPDGKPVLEDENSHDTGFADGGWDYLTWRLVDKWIQHDRATFIGISDMEHPAPRRIKHRDGGYS
jgi:hypothetical protein